MFIPLQNYLKKISLYISYIHCQPGPFKHISSGNSDFQGALAASNRWGKVFVPKLLELSFALDTITHELLLTIVVSALLKSVQDTQCQRPLYFNHWINQNYGVLRIHRIIDS